MTLNIRGKIIEMDRPRVMGIVNITPDSFYPGSRAMDAAQAVARTRTLLEEGADIIDIGACSTRPGSTPPSPREEMERLECVMPAIRGAFPEALISIDTYRAEVAGECLRRWHVEIINDVSGGEDPSMYATVAGHGAAYVLMHTRGDAASMDSLAAYGDVVAETVSELAFRLDKARLAGLSNVIIDPGFGFAKSAEQSLRLLSRLDWLKELGCPILVGISRKRMAREAAECEAADSLVPTVALNAVAISKGADFIRVHDVREGVLTAKTIGKLWNLE